VRLENCEKQLLPYHVCPHGTTLELI